MHTIGSQHSFAALQVVHMLLVSVIRWNLIVINACVHLSVTILHCHVVHIHIHTIDIGHVRQLEESAQKGTRLYQGKENMKSRKLSVKAKLLFMRVNWAKDNQYICMLELGLLFLLYTSTITFMNCYKSNHISSRVRGTLLYYVYTLSITMNRRILLKYTSRSESLINETFR
jgi:hypothetical protein